MSNNTAATFQFSSTNTILPKGDLYVDTNAWMDISLQRSNGPVTESYMRKYASQDGTPIILWSPHNADELMQGLHVDQYKKESSIRGIPDNLWKKTENKVTVSEASQVNEEILKRYNTMFNTFSSSVYEIDIYSIMPTVEEIMRIYGVPFKDAKHLAYMWHEETNNILTSDRRFSLIPGLNIYSKNIKTNGNNPYFPEDFMPDLPEELRRR